jgi:hypothetical protein
MLVLLPTILLLLAAMVILILQWIRRGYGFAWLIAAIVAVASWAIFLVFHWRVPPPFVLASWEPVRSYVVGVSFKIDQVSWPYAFSLAGLVSAVILTAGARLQHRSNPYVWAGSLAVAGMGFLGVLASSPVALILSWTAIDLFELLIMLGSVNEKQLSQQAVIAFSARVAGSLVVIWALLLSQSDGVPLMLDSVLPGVSIYLLIASGLRLGVFPLHLPYPQEILKRRGLGNILRMVAPASSLVLLGRLPAEPISAVWQPLLIAFVALAVLYGGSMWLAAPDEVRGRPYWIISLSGLAIACVIQGVPMASQAWGIALLLSGGVIFLFSARQTSIIFIPLLGALGLSGLPFTPAAGGWAGLMAGHFSLLSLVFIIAVALLLVGYLRHSFRPGDSLLVMDRWIHVVYPAGILLLVVSQWLIVILGGLSTFTAGIWWASLLASILAGGIFFGVIGLRRIQVPTGYSKSWLSVLLERSGDHLAAFFRLEWLYSLLSLFYLIIQRLIQFLTTILEGDGGVLWVLLLLALLVSLLQAGGIK